jgi:hypothetical protein
MPKDKWAEDFCHFQRTAISYGGPVTEGHMWLNGNGHGHHIKTGNSNYAKTNSTENHMRANPQQRHEVPYRENVAEVNPTLETV